MANMTRICNDNQSLNEMINSYREGNEDVFSEIYSACREIAEAIFYKTLSMEQRSRLSFDDLFQDSVVKAWRNLDRFDEKRGSFHTWFGTIFKNTFYDAEKVSRIRMHEDISSIDETQISSASFGGFSYGRMIEDDCVGKETLEEILECMEDALSAEQREAVCMFYLDGMSVEEISKAQGCGINSVKSRLHQSRNKLMPRLEERGLAS